MSRGIPPGSRVLRIPSGLLGLVHPGPMTGARRTLVLLLPDGKLKHKGSVWGLES